MLERIWRRPKKDVISPIVKIRAGDIATEIEDCFAYFNEYSLKILGDQPTILIHGNGIEIRRVEGGKGYSVGINGSVKTVGVDIIPKPQQIEIVRRIRNITIPYAEHVKAEREKH